MLAIILGYLLIVLGFCIVILPVLITELSRPRDSVWGAIIMILGLILINSYERFNGSPMVAVLLSSCLFSRLFLEISQNRWQFLTLEEKTSLKTFSRFKNSFNDTIAAFGELNSIVVGFFKLFKPKPKPSSIGKKWIRPDLDTGLRSVESKQIGSPEANIKEKDLVQDQTIKSTSGKNTSETS